MVGQRQQGRRRVPQALAAVLLAMAATACGTSAGEPDDDPDQVDSIEPPELGACRLLDPEDIGKASNATETVECSQRHTAQTYAVGDMPDQLDDADYDSRDVGAFAFRTCSDKLRSFLGADESLALRTLLTWAWFRPSEKAWDEGARWYRCDVVAGSEGSDALTPLPPTAEGLLMGRPKDKWLVCVAGPQVAGAPRVPCSKSHDWRAVTTIKLGEPDEEYPGDRLVEVRTRDFCRSSVSAWLSYPVDFDYAYTWFHEAEWEAGNRRSVCWAKTPD